MKSPAKTAGGLLVIATVSVPSRLVMYQGRRDPQPECAIARSLARKRVTVVNCPHFADQALVNRAANASRPRVIDPLRKSRSCPSPGRKRKAGPLCSSQLHKGPDI